MKNKTLLIAATLSLALFNSFAQTAKQLAVKRMIDSMKMVALADYATRYPILRQGAFSTDIIGTRTVKGELNGKDLYEGKMSLTRIRSNFNIPFAQWGKNAVTGTISYQQLHFDTKEITSYNPAFANNDRSITKRAVGFTASFNRSDSLFDHPINYSGSLSGLTDEASSIKRVNYLGAVNMSLSRTATSSWTVGFAVIIDPSSVAPFIPFVSYWHKYKDADLDLYVDLPYRLALRKQLSKRSWAFIGTELGGNIYFFDLNQPSLPQNTVYSSIDLKTGATIEYLLTKKLVVGIGSGIYTTAQSRMFDHNAKTSDYFFKTSNGSAPYINFSISFLPFLKSFR